MSQVVQQHRDSSPAGLRCGVLTISDTRSIENDAGGQTVVDLLAAAGHTIAERRIIADEPGPMAALLSELCKQVDLDAILLTGGTGVSSRDQTFETVSGLLTKLLPGYGELFRSLSFQEIGPAAMLSRAVGGLMGTIVVLTMPGSPAAVRLAMTRLILPELGHLVREARRWHSGMSLLGDTAELQRATGLERLGFIQYGFVPIGGGAPGLRAQGERTR